MHDHEVQAKSIHLQIAQKYHDIDLKKELRKHKEHLTNIMKKSNDTLYDE